MSWQPDDVADRPITYTWDLGAGLPVIVQDGTHSYVYGLGGSPISQTDGAGNQSYFLRNGLGSTEKLTDGSGNVVASYKYDVFGASGIRIVQARRPIFCANNLILVAQEMAHQSRAFRLLLCLRHRCK